MTLVPTDPDFDTAIRKTPPKDAPVFSVRAVPAPSCER
jgi:hypothetical protein